MKVKGGRGSYKRRNGGGSAQNMFAIVKNSPIEVLLLYSFVWSEGGGRKEACETSTSTEPNGFGVKSVNSKPGFTTAPSKV